MEIKVLTSVVTSSLASKYYLRSFVHLRMKDSCEVKHGPDDMCVNPKISLFTKVHSHLARRLSSRERERKHALEKR